MTHGDLETCGRDYSVRDGAAYCPACGERFPAHERQHTIVTLAPSTARAWGGRNLPKNGRIVGVSGSFPIVQWSDGMVAPIALAGIRLGARKDDSRI